jgi:hypothetical protein
VIDKTESGAAKVQYDTDGQAIGYLFKADKEHVELVLRPNFRLVFIPETRRLRIWDRKNDKLIELAK